jgi:hypothetical protein
MMTGLLFASIADAQSIGIISGTILDPTGLVIPNVQVTIRNEGTGQQRVVVADSAGHYTATELPIGNYSVKASASGFRPVENRNLNLEVGQNRTVDFVLQLASVGTEVQVSSQVAQIEVQRSDATLSQVIHPEEVAQLPLNGRDFVQLALLGAGTVRNTKPNDFLNAGASSEVSYRGTVSLSAQGMRENANDWLYDGVDDNELTAGGIGTLPSIDAIAEFRVLVFNYSAQYGSRGGTTVLVSSKSGSNAFHGTAFEFLRNTDLDARNFFDISTKSKYNQNEFGASLGGPIEKNKTFFFTDFQVNTIRKGDPTLSTVPTALQRQGIFTESFPGAAQGIVADPSTAARTPFPNNTIPASRIDPIGSALANMFPLPTYTNILANNYFLAPVERIDDALWDFRLDHNVGDNDRFFGRFTWDDATRFFPSGLPGFGAASGFSSNARYATHARNIAASESHVFSPTMVNVFTAGYNRDFNYIWSVGYGTDESAKLGIPGANLGTPETSSMGMFTLTGYNPIGDREFAPFQGGTNVYHLVDAVDIIKGGHAIHTGFSARIMQENTLGDTAFAGLFAFNALFTATLNSSGVPSTGGNTIASLLLGLPTTGARNNDLDGSVRGRRWKEYRGFVQDDWTVSRSLTLNLGLAYDVTTPMSEAHNRFSNLIFPTGQVLIAGQNTNSAIGMQTDWSGVEPRFGFAWSPFQDKKTVFRGGYGMFHDVSAQGGTTGPYENPPYANAYAFTSNNITPVRTLSTGFPDNSQPISPANYTGNWYSWDPNYKMGRIQQWNLNIQRQLPGSTVLTVAYAGTHGTRLMEKNFNFNSAPPGPYTNPASLRPYPQYNNIYLTDSHGWLRYDSLEVKAERRVANGLYILAAYTYSKAFTNGLTQEITGDPGQTYYPLKTYPNADKGLGSSDLRQNFTLSYVYQLPFGKGQKFLSDLHGVSEALIGGWQVNGITLAHTGFPLGMTMATNQSGNGIGNRPNHICDGKLSNPTVHEWFDITCFAAPAVGTLGNAARTTLYGPGQVNFDVSVFKRFHITENGNLEFRSEFFNIGNHSQFQTPAMSYGASTFGTITATVNQARQVQFALKYLF